MRSFAPTVLLIFQVAACHAQTPEENVVRMKNGIALRGFFVEYLEDARFVDDLNLTD